MAVAEYLYIVLKSGRRCDVDGDEDEEDGVGVKMRLSGLAGEMTQHERCAQVAMSCQAKSKTKHMAVQDQCATQSGTH